MGKKWIILIAGTREDASCKKWISSRTKEVRECQRDWSGCSLQGEVGPAGWSVSVRVGSRRPSIGQAGPTPFEHHSPLTRVFLPSHSSPSLNLTRFFGHMYQDAAAPGRPVL